MLRGNFVFDPSACAQGTLVTGFTGGELFSIWLLSIMGFYGLDFKERLL
jgi:hypothetical protein